MSHTLLQGSLICLLKSINNKVVTYFFFVRFALYYLFKHSPLIQNNLHCPHCQTNPNPSWTSLSPSQSWRTMSLTRTTSYCLFPGPFVVPLISAQFPRPASSSSFSSFLLFASPFILSYFNRSDTTCWSLFWLVNRCLVWCIIHSPCQVFAFIRTLVGPVAKLKTLLAFDIGLNKQKVHFGGHLYLRQIVTLLVSFCRRVKTSTHRGRFPSDMFS